MQSKFSSIYKYYSEIKREIYLPLRYATLTFLWLVLWLICASIMSLGLKLHSRRSKYVYQKSSLLTSFSIFYYTKKPPYLLICKKYSKIYCRLLTQFFQSSIIALIEIFSKGKYHVYKIKTYLYRSSS